MKAENEPAISIPVYFKSVKKKKKQNKPTKQKEKKSLPAGVEPRTIKVWGQRVCHYAPRQLTLNKSVKLILFNIFCSWNSTG